MNAPVTDLAASLRSVPAMDEMVARDRKAAAAIPMAAQEKLKTQLGFTPQTSMAHGVAKSQWAVAQGLAEERVALREVEHHAFHAMLEAELESDDLRHVLWYAHQAIRRTVSVEIGGQTVLVVPWTHPAMQVGLVAGIGECEDIRGVKYKTRSVRPLARARFTRLLPELAGVYEPGGVVGGAASATTPSGLRAVKLEMSPEQVKAFIARMNGVLLVTGAPGTGKTTVAFQRIRFLLDQQHERESAGVAYAPALTRVFLASQNLIDYSKRLLKDELQIPGEVVSYVPDFVAKYTDDMWRVTGRARPITRKMDPSAERAREAMLNLCSPRDLEGVWAALEAQVANRLAQGTEPDWQRLAASVSGELGRLAAALAEELARPATRSRGHLLDSPFRLDAVWRRARTPYNDLRSAMSEKNRDKFDEGFAAWLYWAYDPLDTLAAYFRTQEADSITRIKEGTGDQALAAKAFAEVLDDWGRRLYGNAERAWVAWLLRFVLPEDASADDSFRGLPRALPQPDSHEYRRWTHVVIDEAQDLAVQEAALLASFVHPSGALTVSADFHQIVSPVHGMSNPDALIEYAGVRDRRLFQQFPFQKNMRQGREIGTFLRAFYRSAFGEVAPFDAGNRVENHKPQLLLGPRAAFAGRIRHLVNVLKQRGTAMGVAVIFVHDDPNAVTKLRAGLLASGIEVADHGNVFDKERVVVTTVERAKGLEFDICVVVGLDDVERGSLNFAKNRAYVALSRPTRKLIMLCEHEPAIFHNVARDLFDRHTFE